MSSLLVKNAHTLVTMDAERREIKNGAIFVRDGVVTPSGQQTASLKKPTKS